MFKLPYLTQLNYLTWQWNRSVGSSPANTSIWQHADLSIVSVDKDLLRRVYKLNVCIQVFVYVRHNQPVMISIHGNHLKITVILYCIAHKGCTWCTCYHASFWFGTVYPKKYAHGFSFAVLCCGYTLTDFSISIRLTSLALWQSNDCPSASKATLMNMDKYFMWIHYERLHNHNKATHNKTVCKFLGIYCICKLYPHIPGLHL